MYTIALVQICSEINFAIENQMVYYMNHNMSENDCSHTILDYVAITTSYIDQISPLSSVDTSTVYT